MTTATVAVGNRTMDTGMARPRRSLEELVDRLIEAMFGAETREARWAFSEWSQMVKRRFGDWGAMVYSQGTGRAAALVPHGDGMC